MLYAHGSDLCHELELRHAMANCFEALMGALLLDGGINVADKVFSAALWLDNMDLKNVSQSMSASRNLPTFNDTFCYVRFGIIFHNIHCKKKSHLAIVSG